MGQVIYVEDSDNLKGIFQERGRLNILSNYRGQQRHPLSVRSEALKLFLISCFWLGLSFGVSVCMALMLGYAVPYALELWLGEPVQSMRSSSVPALQWLASLYHPMLGLIRSFAPILSVVGFIPFNAMFLVLLERKFLSILTNRLGPNRVGFNGIFQTVADSLKLLFKEDLIPARADKFLFVLAPILFFAPSILVFLPIMSVASRGLGVFAGTDMPNSLIFVFGMSALSVFGLVLAGHASYSKYSLLGGLRSVAQAISYEIPLIMCLVAFVVCTGSMNLLQIADRQSANIFSWNIFAGGALGSLAVYVQSVAAGHVQSVLPILGIILKLVLFPVLAVIIYSCFLAECYRTPFDLPEAESELVGGFSTEYSGIKFALFFLAEYTNLFAFSAVFVILFLGGGHVWNLNGLLDMLPPSPYIDPVSLKNLNILRHTWVGDLTWMPVAFILLLKSYLMVLVAIWIRATLPRFRSDQYMDLAWKKLIPASMFCILAAALCKILIAGH